MDVLPAHRTQQRKCGQDAEPIVGRHGALLIWLANAIRLFADPLALYPVWHDNDFNAVSSSFFAVANAARRLSADPQCVYEYVFQGATYGDRTVFRKVCLLAARTELTLGDEVSERTVHTPFAREVRDLPIEGHLETCLANLHRYYDAIASASATASTPRYRAATTRGSRSRCAARTVSAYRSMSTVTRTMRTCASRRPSPPPKVSRSSMSTRAT